MNKTVPANDYYEELKKVICSMNNQVSMWLIIIIISDQNFIHHMFLKLEFIFKCFNMKKAEDKMCLALNVK